MGNLELLKSQLVNSVITDIEYTDDDQPIVLILDNGDRLEIFAASESVTLLTISLTNQYGIETINI